MSWSPYEAEHYVDFDEVESFCRSLASAHPEWVELEEVGTSREDRPLLMMTIGAEEPGPTGQPRGERPALWIDGGTHATEWTGVSAALYVISRWIERLVDGDEAYTDWFTRHEVLAMPCISPDGYQATHEGSPFLRSTLRPPADGTVRSGLDPCDVDGDGTVRMMRWKHPAGSFVEDPDWAPFLRPRKLDDDPDDAYFLCDEGEFINWNGVDWTQADTEYGVDLNRNFPAHWKPFSMFGMDSGAYPLSEPESRAVVDAFREHPSVGCAVTLHTYSGCILTQPYRQDTPLGDDDIELMQLLAEDLVADTGYDVFKTYPEFMYEDGTPIPGVWADTLATVFGVPGYTVELWDPFDHVGVEIEEPAKFFQDPDEETVRETVRGFARQEANVQDWETVDHPQLGEVEIGGLEYLRTLRNPPDELLADECETAWQIIERARRALPEVEAHVEIEQIGPDTHRLRLVLENHGFLPTSGLDRGQQVAETPEVGVELELDDEMTVQGPTRRALDHMEGWGNLRTGSGRHPSYASLQKRGHRTWTDWELSGSGTVAIDWVAGRGGSGRLTVELP